MTVYVSGAHVPVQRLVSVVNMVTVLEESVLLCVLYGEKDSMQRIFIKKCFIFTVGSVYRVEGLISGWQTFR
jgi:hypothetical protein